MHLAVVISLLAFRIHARDIEPLDHFLTAGENTTIISGNTQNDILLLEKISSLNY